MAFFDEKNDGLQTDTELDPVDEILKHINEKKIEVPEGQTTVQAGDEAEPEVLLDDMPETENEPEEPIDEDMLCVRCGEKRKDTSVAEDYDYCADCRSEMLKAPISWKGFAVAIAMIILTGAAVVIAAFTAVVALPVTDADSYIAENRLNDALASYSEADKAAADLNTQFKLENFFTPGTKTFVKKMQVTAKSSSPLAVGNNLSEVIENAASYKTPWLKPLKQYSDMFTAFQNTQKAVEPIFADYDYLNNQELTLTAKDIPYDALVAKLEALKTGKDAEKYAAYMLEYYKTYAAVLADKGAQTELKHMLAVKKLAPEADWLYNYYIADCYKRLEKYDDLIKVCDEIIAKNLNSVEVYAMKARAYSAQKDFTKALAVCDELEKNNGVSAVGYSLRAEFFRRKGDISKAASLCEEGINSTEGSTELYRQQAIALLLKGDKFKKAAYEAANNAYNSAYYNSDTTLELMNTIALCASIAGEKEMYEETVNSLESNGYKLADSVTQYIKGTITLKEIFVTGKGDVL